MEKVNIRLVVAIVITFLITCLVCFLFYRPSIFGVAQTINGNVIMEKAVTKYIQNDRELNGLTDENSWKEYLEDNNQTPEIIRYQALSTLGRDLVCEIVAKERGVSVSDEELTKKIDELISQEYHGDDGFKEYLSKNKLSESDYRHGVYLEMLQDKVEETFDTNVEEVDVLTSINEKYPEKTRIYHYYILTWNTNDEQANANAKRVRNGKMTFEEFAQSLGTSLDYADSGYTTTGDTSIDVGNALESISENSPSKILKDYNGDENISAMVMYDDMFFFVDAPQEKSDVSDGLYNYVEYVLTDEAQNELYSEYCQNYYTSAEIITFSPPANLEYDIN